MVVTKSYSYGIIQYGTFHHKSHIDGCLIQSALAYDFMSYHVISVCHIQSVGFLMLEMSYNGTKISRYVHRSLDMGFLPYFFCQTASCQFHSSLYGHGPGGTYALIFLQLL